MGTSLKAEEVGTVLGTDGITAAKIVEIDSALPTGYDDGVAACLADGEKVLFNVYMF